MSQKKNFFLGLITCDFAPRIFAILRHLILLTAIRFSILVLTIVQQFVLVFLGSEVEDLRGLDSFHHLSTVQTDFTSYFVSELSCRRNQEESPHLGKFSHETPYSEYRERAATCKLYFEGEVEDFVQGEDTLLIPMDFERRDLVKARSFTAYKPVDRRVRPISGTFPQEALVRRSFPHDPLEGLQSLSKNPPEFIPSQHITAERYKQMNINSEGF